MKFKLRTLMVLVTIVAVAVLYVSRPPSSLSEVKGVRLLGTSRGDQNFLFEPAVSRRSVAHVIRLLPVGGRIDFYDGKHPTISDPGAYGTLCRIGEREFCVHYGNHGWSSGWFAISGEEAVEYFWICHSDNLVDQPDWPHTKMRFDLTPLKVPKEINRDPDFRSVVYLRELLKKH